MCNLADLLEERREERGRKYGEELKVIQLMLKKMKKFYPAGQIAEFLEGKEEKISRIIKIAEKYAPEYDERQIYYDLTGDSESKISDK